MTLNWGKKESEYKQDIAAMKRAFGTPEGKRAFAYLCNKFHFLNTHGGDPFKEGQRSVLLEIIKLREMDLERLEAIFQGDSSA